MSSRNYLTAQMNGHDFAIPAFAFREIATHDITATVPGAARGICGIALHDGIVIPIYDIFCEAGSPTGIHIIFSAGDHLAAHTATAIGEFIPIDDALIAAADVDPRYDVPCLELDGRRLYLP